MLFIPIQVVCFLNAAAFTAGHFQQLTLYLLYNSTWFSRLYTKQNDEGNPGNTRMAALFGRGCQNNCRSPLPAVRGHPQHQRQEGRTGSNDRLLGEMLAHELAYSRFRSQLVSGHAAHALEHGLHTLLQSRAVEALRAICQPRKRRMRTCESGKETCRTSQRSRA